MDLNGLTKYTTRAAVYYIFEMQRQLGGITEQECNYGELNIDEGKAIVYNEEKELNFGDSETIGNTLEYSGEVLKRIQRGQIIPKEERDVDKLDSKEEEKEIHLDIFKSVTENQEEQPLFKGSPSFLKKGGLKK
eukprot:CAMPEP_0170553650 /NCGR_PEP_ID=MMETSP0211-20121228/11492_1 /TAXON_ID=311385 /ORGANISM="Pseudokeronopsis sp., Strain OXSARD2" /LENGTH=133 /DNA_ID=CAMNT_0010862127 /DNA_START=306 /DNA_END=704 /DNA_ORIENTATION=-